MRQSKVHLVVALACLILTSCASSHIDKPKAGAPAATAPSGQVVNLLVMADWGMNNDKQRRVAEAMKDYVKRSGEEFAGVLCGGDNLYVKLKDVKDPMWDQVFETMYDKQVLNFPFYVVAGNHDYQDFKLPIELQYSVENPKSRWKYPSQYYRLDVPGEPAAPLVTVLMLDSNRDDLKDWNGEIEWLRNELAKPQAAGTWRIAVAHHPMFSNGMHGDNGVLQRAWGSLFKQYGLDMYICGHDHDVQHLEVPGWPMSFLLVGGGGASLRPMVVDRRGPFSKSMNGFAHLQFTPQRMIVRLIDQEGNVVHTFERTHDGQVQVLQTIPSDVGRPRTPKSINRPETAPTTKQGED